MQNIEIENQNFVMRLLLDLGIPVYVPVGIRRSFVIKLPRVPLKSCLVTTGRTDARHGTYVDLHCVNEDYLQCDLLLVVDNEHTRCWVLPVDGISQNRTVSLNNKDDWDLVNICTSSVPSDPVVDRNRIIEILKQHNLGVKAQDELSGQIE